MKSVRRNYKEWLYFITSQINSFGCESIFDFVTTDLDEDWCIEHLEPEDEDDKETLIAKKKDRRKWIQGKKEVLKNRIDFDKYNPSKLLKPRSEEEKYLHEQITKAIDLLSDMHGLKSSIYQFQGKDDSEQGCLGLNLIYMIFDKYYDASDWVEYFVMEEHLDMTANQVGVSGWTVESLEDEIFDPSKFNFEFMEKLTSLFYIMFELEKKFS